MNKRKNNQNYPNKRKDDYYSMIDDETVGKLDTDKETLEFLKSGKTLGGRRLK